MPLTAYVGKVERCRQSSVLCIAPVFVRLFFPTGGVGLRGSYILD